ncbi:MAG: hypothetical protein K2X38_00220 [Gemmataceae bacterium]|nr:hypothetical protein [Gemmataceae bacterium]
MGRRTTSNRPNLAAKGKRPKPMKTKSKKPAKKGSGGAWRSYVSGGDEVPF